MYSNSGIRTKSPYLSRANLDYVAGGEKHCRDNSKWRPQADVQGGSSPSPGKNFHLILMLITKQQQEQQ